jgi:hypothetical protein
MSLKDLNSNKGFNPRKARKDLMPRVLPLVKVPMLPSRRMTTSNIFHVERMYSLKEAAAILA